MADKQNNLGKVVAFMFWFGVTLIIGLGCIMSEVRHRIEYLEKLQGLPQDRVFWRWPWNEDESRIELDIPRQQETQP